MTRHSAYYMRIYVTPVCFLVLLIPLMFLLPPDSSEKLTYGEWRYFHFNTQITGRSGVKKSLSRYRTEPWTQGRLPVWAKTLSFATPSYCRIPVLDKGESLIKLPSLGQAGASRKFPNDKSWKTLSQRLSGPIFAPLRSVIFSWS